MGDTFLEVEDLQVYQKLCDVHLEVSELVAEWPSHERYELSSQVRRSSNSAPLQLAEKNDDRHVRNKIEDVNRARGEIGETIHHLYIGHRKRYLGEAAYRDFREKYKSCIRMLNGLEKTLERKLPAKERRWDVEEPQADYTTTETCRPGWPEETDP